MHEFQAKINDESTAWLWCLFCYVIRKQIAPDLQFPRPTQDALHIVHLCVFVFSFYGKYKWTHED